MSALRLCLLSLLSFSPFLAAQTSPAPTPTTQAAAPTADGKIHLDVLVRSASGSGQAGLKEQDLTVLDDGHPQALSSFRAVAQGQEPAEIIFVMDAANVRHTNLSYQQTQLQEFLRSMGKLPHPATIAVLGDQGVEIQKGFSTDGQALSKVLDGYNAALRTITRAAGFWGATERLDLSLKGMSELTAYARTLPGRKFLIWISPGWPLLTGPGVELSNRQDKAIFDRVVAFSNELRDARVTVYDINPFGLEEPLINATYYEEFVKGVRRDQDAQLAYLGLQVMAVQSGGRTITTNNDIKDGLKQCVSETSEWYEVTYPASPTEKPNQYHTIEVKVSDKGERPGVMARTRTGYYAQPLQQQ
ncbi:MAG TPA: VWA domain-containing protein [Acidobacteriaceae bacterium]